MKFIHSADWQLGARFAQFGEKAEALRAARLRTFERALQIANEHRVDAFLIAGDLFEDNGVEDSLVKTALDCIGAFSSVPVFILPGNHDPHTGPDSVWNRALFKNGAPKNLVVFHEPVALPFGEAIFFCAPLRQKISTLDPSLEFLNLAKKFASDAKIKIGITHGALAIPGKFQPNDFPIALDAATRAGLDYVAIGHWHQWQIYDQNRLVMPGTPEPDAFDQAESGSLALVEISAPGAQPRIERLPVATLNWRVIEFDFSDADFAQKKIESEFAALRAKNGAGAQNAVVRVRLSGAASPLALVEITARIHELGKDFLALQIRDETVAALTETERQHLEQNHILLAQVFADLAQMEHFATSAPASPFFSATNFSLAEAQQICADARTELTALNANHFKTARQHLFNTLQELRG